MKKTLYNIKGASIVASLAATVLVGCRNDFDFESQYMQKLEYSYAKSFEKIYGEIDPDQSWDFSSSAKANGGTRAIGEISDPMVDTDWYYVEDGTLGYYQQQLKEGDSNKTKGKPFVITAPQRGFKIYPIYQGAASMVWDLHMVVEDSENSQDILVWEKHSNIENQLSDETLEYDADPTKKLSLYDGKNFYDEYGWNRNGETWYTTYQSYTLHDSHTEYLGGASWGGEEPGQKGWWENYECGWNTMQAKAIRTKGISFTGIPEGATISFYLKVWKSQEDKKDRNATAKQESSKNHMMIALPCSRPSNIDSNLEAILIGCEDNSGDDSDWDMNDLGLLVVGDHVEVVEDKKIITAKRYMVEDLGSTDDLDFNDVVVDLQIYQDVRFTTGINGDKTMELIGDPKQRAIVRCMGGTLDFDLFIGGTRILTKSEMSCDAESIVASEMYNTLPGPGNIDYYKEMVVADNISGWIPDDNNIAFRVHRKDAVIEISDYDSYNVYDTTVPGYTYIEFPRTGQVPYMMAFDISKKWRDERHMICRHWVEGTVNETDKCNQCE